VKIGDGPAAVIGDKSRCKPLMEKVQNAKLILHFKLCTLHCICWEGAVSRMNRKSEDLPELHKKIGNFRGQELLRVILG